MNHRKLDTVIDSKARTEDLMVNGKDHPSEIQEKASNRRNFVRKLGIAAAGTAAAAVTGEKAFADNSNDLNDVRYINFLMNLEFLLAEYYTLGTTGSTIAQNGVAIDGSIGIPGPTTGGRLVPDFHTASHVGKLGDIATQVSWDEVGHIYNMMNYVRSYFSTEYDHIAKPAINVNALGFGFGSYQEFVVLGRMLEDLTISAYNSVAPNIYDYDVFDMLAGNLAVHGQHAGNLRAQIAGLSMRTKALDCVDIIPPAGPGGQPWQTNPGLFTIPILPPPNGAYFSTFYGMTITRDPGQVLYWLYGNAANAAGGGFFPNGINGDGYLSTTSGNGFLCSPHPIATPRSWPKRTAAAPSRRAAQQPRMPRQTIQNNSLIQGSGKRRTVRTKRPQPSC